MNRYCIFTAIVGGYDEVKQPLVVDKDFDYLLFSDDFEVDRIGVWEVRSLGYLNKVQTKTARYVKTHPEFYCNSYELSVWVDANVMINSSFFYDRVKCLYDKGILVASLIHPNWTCTYQEMFYIMYLGWESERLVMDWGHKLRGENFPREMGTYETRVLYRKHTDKSIQLVDELWWDCIDSFSRRDQLSFRYCLWKFRVDCDAFLPKKHDVHYNECFVVVNHLKKCILDKVVDKGKKSWLMRYYLKHADERKKIENIYYWIYGRKHYNVWLGIIGQCYRVKHLLLYFFGRKEVRPWDVE